jgi:hypothetical protein
VNRRRLGIGLGVIAAVLVAGFVYQFLAAEDEIDVEDSIEEVATTSDPSFCRELVTPAYLAQIYALPTDAAVAACEQYSDEEVLQADSVEVTEVEVDGDTATAEATYRGSAADGSTLRIGLVHEDGEWKLNRVLGAEVDRAGFLSASREQLVDPLFGFPPESADCVVRELGNLPDSELEALLVSSDAIKTGTILAGCDRAAFEGLLVAAVADPAAGFPGSLITCVQGALAAASERRVVELYAGPIPLARIAIGCDRPAYLESYRRLLEDSPNDYEDSAIDCIMAELDQLSDEALAGVTYNRTRLRRLIDACDG